MYLPVMDKDAQTMAVQCMMLMMVCVHFLGNWRNKFLLVCATGCLWAAVYSIPAFHTDHHRDMYTLVLMGILVLMEMALTSSGSNVVGGTCVVAIAVILGLESPSIAGFLRPLPGKCSASSMISAATIAWDTTARVLSLDTTITITCARVYFWGLLCALAAIASFVVYKLHIVNAKLFATSIRCEYLEKLINVGAFTIPYRNISQPQEQHNAKAEAAAVEP